MSSEQGIFIGGEYNIVVSGPTGSGKSALSLRLAQALGGEIVNGDSVQVYKDHQIGAAMPSDDVREQVAHHLYEIIDGDTAYDVAAYLAELHRVLASLHERSVRPILTGGSTLYLNSWLSGLSELPPRDEAVRAELEKQETATLHSELQSIDAVRAEELHPNDRVRIVRALEIAKITGEQPSVLTQRKDRFPAASPALLLVLIWPRSELYKRIDSRSKQMIDNGLVGETEMLHQKFDESWQGAHSLGYAQALQFLSGECSTESELLESIAQATRRYAKRQMTFWRNTPKKNGWKIAPAMEDADVVLGDDVELKKSRVSSPRGFPCFSWEFEKLVEQILSCKLGEKSEVWYLDARRLAS